MAIVSPEAPPIPREPPNGQDGQDTQSDKVHIGPRLKKVRCKFYENGHCRKGEECTFSHDMSSSASPSSIGTLEIGAKKVCKFYARGNCAHGTKCRYEHPPQEELFCPNRPCDVGEGCTSLHWKECRHCHTYCLHPLNKEQRQKHRENCPEALRAQSLYENTVGVECGICLDEICTTEDGTFGILPSCSHAFCLKCITKWRKQGKYEKNISRGCPQCRQVSFYVFPSKRWLEGEDKAKFIAEKKERMKHMPCQNFAKGECKFNKSCFFRHDVDAQKKKK